MNGAPLGYWETTLDKVRTQTVATVLREYGPIRSSRYVLSANPLGSPTGQSELSEISDPVLGRLELNLSVSNDPRPTSQDTFLLAFRVGLALKIWDKVTEHLKTRVSGQQKTIQHEAVMLSCSESLVKLSAISNYHRAQIPSETSGHSPSTQRYLHEEVTAATDSLVRLMGGHGYLEGSIADLGYLSRSLTQLTFRESL